jgi:hypothetical protein
MQRPGQLVLARVPLDGAEPTQRLCQLCQDLERLVPVQSRSALGQHRDRPAPVLDELRDRQVDHVRSIGERVFDKVGAMDLALIIAIYAAVVATAAVIVQVVTWRYSGARVEVTAN